MENEILQYMDAIIYSYKRAFSNEVMLQGFFESCRLDEGSKYIKVVCNNSVHSFIVKEDGPMFNRGDILKAASWRAPALNFARGNVLTGDFKDISWTGA